MREKRNGLRPVKLPYAHNEYVNGYFHKFITTGDQQNGFNSTAIIEREDGSIEEWDAVGIIFDDIEI